MVEPSAAVRADDEFAAAERVGRIVLVSYLVSDRSPGHAGIVARSVSAPKRRRSNSS
jgi:hypothetical protein